MSRYFMNNPRGFLEFQSVQKRMTDIHNETDRRLRLYCKVLGLSPLTHPEDRKRLVLVYHAGHYMPAINVIWPYNEKGPEGP